MKNIKRIAVITLAVMLAVVFAGCGIAKKPSGGNAGGGSPIPAPQSDSIEKQQIVLFSRIFKI